METRAALVLTLLFAGCHDAPLDGSVAVDALPDVMASADAGPLPCATGTPTLLCAEFDEATPLVYEQGAPVTVVFPASGSGVTAALVSPGVSPPSALDVNSQTAPWSFDDHGAGSAVGHLHATFWMNMVRASANTVALFTIGNEGSNDSDCVASLQYVRPPRMDVTTSCGGSNTSQAVMSGFPHGWVSCSLDFDVATQQATLTISGNNPASVQFAHTAVAGAALVRIGVLDATSAGPEVMFDDVVVTASP